MNLSKFPRRHYTSGVTPIERLDNLTKELGGPTIYMKRDDQLGLAGGGTKTRKLEFLMADAVASGADTIITCGDLQSNHCRLTLAAACKEGMKCQLVILEADPAGYDRRANGNYFICELLGVEAMRIVGKDRDLALEMEQLADELRKDGRKPYIIPRGASCALGDLGCVACAHELTGQLFDMDLDISAVIVPSVAGTHAGILAGFIGENTHIPVIGMSVNRKKEPQSERIYALTSEILDMLRVKTPLTADDVHMFDGDVCAGYYDQMDDAIVEAVRTVARTEAILIDPHYNGTAMAIFLAMIKSGYFRKNESVLYVHTGGTPALFGSTGLFYGEE